MPPAPSYAPQYGSLVGGQQTLAEQVRGLLSVKALLIVVIIFQVILMLIAINPGAAWQQFQNNLLLNEVKGKVEIATTEAPVIATVSNADELRKANGAQAQVYKDAQVGDYVIGFADRLIVYRRQSGEVVYDGVTPAGLVTEAQRKLTEAIVKSAKSRSLIGQDSTEIPQISIITDVETLRRNDPTFYANARNNDVVGLFPVAQVIVLYTQESQSIINSGKYATSIQRL